jgi:Cu(I)/Ag(I) efflux system membrane fusion protein
MDLVPVYEETRPEVPVSNSFFTVTPQRQQLIGVMTEAVAVRPLEKTIRTVGLVELDETKIVYVHTKVRGWIEKVFINFTGQQVKKGEPLFTLYSPDLVSTQEEYLLALQNLEKLSDSHIKEAREGAASLVNAARERLLLWDITERQIQELAERGKPQRFLAIHSPITGHVVYKNVFENMYVEPGSRLYTVADHTTVWVHAEIYENEIRFVKLGHLATMTTPSYPGKVFKGKVTFIWPHLESQTRTLKIRIEIPNPNLDLKPNMYATVELHVPLGKKLAIPESAVLRTGKRNIVFVDHGEGRMEIRDIKTGINVNRYYEVLAGLKPGERIVTAANFLIDAESKVQGAELVWEGPPKKSSQQEGG